MRRERRAGRGTGRRAGQGTGRRAAEPVDPLARLRAHVPHQVRSRRTLTRLLDAAEAILSEEGAEAATVPAIARRAGVSVGVVYRRFPDKDGLLLAVYTRFFARQRERNEATLRPEMVGRAGLGELTRGVIGGLVAGYRLRRGLLRTFLMYARAHPDSAVRRYAQEMTRETMPRIAALLLMRREAIGHPDPAAAVRFGLTAVALAAQSIVILDEPWPPGTLPPNRRLEEELTRLFLGYLGVAPALIDATLAQDARPTWAEIARGARAAVQGEKDPDESCG